MEWIRTALFELSDDFVGHPLDLRAGEFDHLVAEIVQKRQRIGEQARLLISPQLLLFEKRECLILRLVRLRFSPEAGPVPGRGQPYRHK